MNKNTVINELDNLNKTIDTTMEKCEWIKSLDSKSSLSSIREELSELNEAIKKNDFDNIEEEIGDLLFTILLIGKVSEKEGKINFNNSIKRINKKIISRSPHVFGDEIANTPDEASAIWNKIKYQEYK